MRGVLPSVVALLAVPLFTPSLSQEFEPKAYCTYGQSCWPSNDVFWQLESDHPTLKVVLKGSSGWEEANDLVLNKRVAKSPGVTIYASTVDDIITIVNFTQRYNMNLKIISSGHEFIGRNAADGCLQLVVSGMMATSVDLNCPENFAGCLTVQPGVWWLQAYKVADSVGRTVLGGAEPSVSVTGWSLGGGHSPFSPKIGLGADQIVELSMVLADLSLVTMNKDGMVKTHSNGTITTSDETDLFWAVRGGGGGTYGVVTSIKFRLHMPPSKFTVMTCEFSSAESPKESMRDILKGMRAVIADLPSEFGGYLFTGTLCYTLYPSCQMAVYATYVFTHYGAVSDNADSFNNIEAASQSLSKYLNLGPCKTVEYDTYYDYVNTLPNITHQTVDMDGTFLSPSEYSDDFIDEEAEIYSCAFKDEETFAATHIRLGGQTKNDSSGATAVNPLFRDAMWTVAYGGEKSYVKQYDDLVEETVTTKGQYYSECDDDLPPGEWQRQFWGQGTYDQLLTIKRKYDPENHFTCLQCVGSMVNHTTASAVVIMLTIFLQKFV